MKICCGPTHSCNAGAFVLENDYRWPAWRLTLLEDHSTRVVTWLQKKSTCQQQNTIKCQIEGVFDLAIHTIAVAPKVSLQVCSRISGATIDFKSHADKITWNKITKPRGSIRNVKVKVSMQMWIRPEIIATQEYNHCLRLKDVPMLMPTTYSLSPHFVPEIKVRDNYL